MPPRQRSAKALLTEKKDKQRLDLAILIEETSDAMDPCSYCKTERRKCIADLGGDSKRCSECIRAKRRCNVGVPLADRWDDEVPSASDWSTVDKQIDQLESQEDEAMAKILRLRKQKLLLKKRKKEMMRCGLRYLDELDSVEEKERLEKEERERAAASSLAA